MTCARLRQFAPSEVAEEQSVRAPLLSNLAYLPRRSNPLTDECVRFYYERISFIGVHNDALILCFEVVEIKIFDSIKIILSTRGISSNRSLP